ncbi:flagellar export chaperone FliS [Oryzomicrobium sp.]|uniref:flagellar export chaperone FliS n=1 Tax=Oryzomicrobium sp. TaxID=1911578 RepID=UPI0025F8A789|nr:flagellar export chaperone FliS [Oryzomicrobium sp.]MCE1241900.1 flagellar export chaperone FliS [Oryzomicrobium sp.]
MFVRRNPIAAYSEVGVETSVASASPHKLILLLFEGARAALFTARLNMVEGNIAEKGAAISKAIDIINNGLKASLDVEAGGNLAEQLSALYEYMVDRLLFANLKNETAPLDEVLGLLGQIHSAWEEIADRPEVTGFVPKAMP